MVERYNSIYCISSREYIYWSVLFAFCALTIELFPVDCWTYRRLIYYPTILSCTVIYFMYVYVSHDFEGMHAWSCSHAHELRVFVNQHFYCHHSRCRHSPHATCCVMSPHSHLLSLPEWIVYVQYSVPASLCSHLSLCILYRHADVIPVPCIPVP